MNIAMTWWICLIVLILLICSELLYFFIANKYNILDKPNERSSHKHITLRGGGVVFLFGAWIWAMLYGLQYPWFMLGLTIIAAVSFLDDLKSLPDSIRLICQFLAIFLMFFNMNIMELQNWWMIILALIIFVGIINAYNFMDGINGITGGYSLAVIVPLLYIDTLAAAFINSNLLTIVGFSLGVFLFFNFRKRAKCFAGDVGAVSIAFILVFAIGRLIMQTRDFTYILLLAVYGVDTVLTIFHRIFLHENLGKAHRKHAYQILANELGLSHLVVTTIYMSIQLLVSFGLIFLPINHWLYLIIVSIVLSATYLIFMKKYYHLHKTYLASLHE